MASGLNTADQAPASFLGVGWSFPPEFDLERGMVRMTTDEADIEASLRILFSTAQGERLFQPEYGLDARSLMFEPTSTTMRTFLRDRIETAILIHEPRIRVVSLEVSSPDADTGELRIALQYEIRANNSRYNLVFPFYNTDGNEALGQVT